MDYSFMTDEELLRLAGNLPLTGLEQELVKRLEKAVEKEQQKNRPVYRTDYPPY